MKPEIVHLTEQNFDAEIGSAERPILVDFWAAWCPPCRILAPVLEEIAAEYAGRVRVGKVDVDENPGLSARYGVQSIPTLILFRGGEVLDQTIGAQPKPALKQLLDTHL